MPHPKSSLSHWYKGLGRCPRGSNFMVVLITLIISCQTSSLGALWWLRLTSCLSSGTLFAGQHRDLYWSFFAAFYSSDWLKYRCLWPPSPFPACHSHLSGGDGYTLRKWQWIALVISRWPWAFGDTCLPESATAFFNTMSQSPRYLWA